MYIRLSAILPDSIYVLHLHCKKLTVKRSDFNSLSSLKSIVCEDILPHIISKLSKAVLSWFKVAFPLLISKHRECFKQAIN